MNFLIDNSKVYTYNDLLASVANEDEYIPLMRTKDLYSFFANMVKALVANRPIVLVDSDISADEIEGVNEGDINKAFPLGKAGARSIGEVLDAVKSSTSEITIFTSGTTGQPKKVVHNITSLTRAVRAGDKYKGQVWGFAYNPTHMAGLQVFFQGFYNLNTFVNLFGKSRSVVYDLIDKWQITHLSATPTFYRLLLPFEHPHGSLVRATLGGEKSDEALYAAVKNIFPNAKITNVYASTEAGSLFAAKGDNFKVPDGMRDKFKVVDGELLIHKSLLGSSDSFTFDGDYYHSGDLIEWVDEAQGLFRFKSRKNELINVGGYKVNPEEVEQHIDSIDGIRQSLVYGKHNSVLGNILCADIVLEPGKNLTEIDIRKKLGNELQDFKVPRRIKFVEELETTRTGKLKRK